MPKTNHQTTRSTKQAPPHNSGPTTPTKSTPKKTSPRSSQTVKSSNRKSSNPPSKKQSGNRAIGSSNHTTKPSVRRQSRPRKKTSLQTSRLSPLLSLLSRPNQTKFRRPKPTHPVLFPRSKPRQAKILSKAKAYFLNVSLPLRRLSSSFRPHLATLCFFTGLSLTTFWGLHQYWYHQSLTFDQNLIAVHTPISLPNLPTHIHIPWKVDVAIEPSVYRQGSWTISADKASFVINSALPGESGNTIIFGHNQRSIMGNIRALTGNETITLTLRDGAKRLYRVTSIHQVPPTNTSFLEPTDTETLTLYTCAGLFDRDRFIAIAHPVEPLAANQ